MANTSSVVPYGKTTKKIRPENLTEIHPPIDFSFMRLTNVDEVEIEEPRITSPRKVVPKAKKTEDDSVEKSQSLCLRLNNNEMKDVANIMTIAGTLFENPHTLGWIDISFNVLSHIEPVLLQFENLKILYLHGNNISDLKEVNKLGGLTKLWKLTLHGNPVENAKGYRYYCLAALPNLASFDFSRITKADRVTTNTLKSFNSSNRHKRTRDD